MHRLVSIGINPNVASTMIPVRPIPPTVAQKRSGRRSGPTSATVPSASSRLKRRTWFPNEPFDVVVLPVNVAGDRPADGDEAGARRDGNEESAWHEVAQQLVEGHGTGRGDGALMGVEHDAVGATVELDDETAAVLSRVSVRTTESASDDTPRRGVLHRGCQLVDPTVDADVGQRRRRWARYDPSRRTEVDALLPPESDVTQRSVRPVGHPPPKFSHDLAEAERQQHLQGDIAGEPDELGELASSVPSPAGR